MCFRFARPHYVCTRSGIHLPDGKHLTTWPEIIRIEAAKLAGGDEINENTYYLRVYTRGNVIRTDTTWENVDEYAAILQGLLEFLPGFGPDWRAVVDQRFAQTARWKQVVFATFYYKDKVRIYPTARV